MNARNISSIAIIILLAGILCLGGCAPVTSTRIGPVLPPRSENCDVAVLEAGSAPDHPYRDVGVIFLKNCPDYDKGACRKWVVAEACRLGGDMVYLPSEADNRNRPEGLSAEVTWTLTVAASVSRLPITDRDPVLHSKPATPCDVAAAEDADDPEDQMCTE